MSVLVDSHAASGAWALGADGSDLPVTLHRIEVTSEDGEVFQLLAEVHLDGPAWARVCAERLLGLDEAPAGTAGAPRASVVLGATADALADLGVPDADALWGELTGEEGGALGAERSWCALVVDVGTGPLASGWAVRRSLGGPHPHPLPAALERPAAVLFQGGWEPSWSPEAPDVVVAGVDPADGWTLAVEVRADPPGTAALVVAPRPDGMAPARADGRGTNGSAPSSHALVDVTYEDHVVVCTAAVDALGADVAADALAGMIDAVLDAAGSLLAP